MKRVYLVDSENVGDVWVPLLAASLPEEEVMVFYTQQSPHMGYENVRLLKETEKTPVFIKCFEGRNALDFQLVTELGYRLRANEECEYIIISTDAGFDAAVRYWSSQKKKVRRLNGKECFRQAMSRLRSSDAGYEEMLKEQTAQTEEAADISEKAQVETVTEETKEVFTQEDTVEESRKEQPEKTKSGARRRRRRETKKQRVGTAEAEAAREAVGLEADAIQTLPEQTLLRAETDASQEGAVKASVELELEETQAETATEMTETQAETASEITETQAETATEMTETQTETVSEMTETQAETAPETVSVPAESLSEMDATEWIVTNLFRCIQKDNLADFHNAMVMFLGEENGKRLYLEAKNSPECNAFWAEQAGNSQKERFDIYCKMVFDNSEPSEKSPEGFSEFLWKANGKRKNLNSLRAALQAQYGKDKGMKYYSLFKSHIKIMNRM